MFWWVFQGRNRCKQHTVCFSLCCDYEMKGRGTLRGITYNWWEDKGKCDMFTWDEQLQPAPNPCFCVNTHTHTALQEASAGLNMCALVLEMQANPEGLWSCWKVFFQWRSNSHQCFNSLLKLNTTLSAFCHWRQTRSCYSMYVKSRQPFTGTPLNLHGWKETWQCSAAESVDTR